MAAYAATVALTGGMRKAEKVGVGGMGYIRGTVDVTNYNTTLAAITALTKYFRDTPTVILSSFSDNGFAGVWVASSKSIKCYAPTQQTGATGNRAGIEAATDTDIGMFHFVAFGRV